MILTEVWVPGHARTKGSLHNNQDTPNSKRWRALVAECVRKDIAVREYLCIGARGKPAMPYPGAVSVVMHVWLPVADPIQGQAGDVDKLARNVLDAIAADAKSAIFNGGVIANDNQVTELKAFKWAAFGDLGHGLLLSVTTAEQRDTFAIDHARRVRGW